MRAIAVISCLLVAAACRPTGGHPSLADPTTEQDVVRLPDPTWQRLGLAESPTPDSGRGVGVVLIDDGGLHSALLPLGNRLKHVIVDEDMNVTLVEPLRDYKPREREDVNSSHGVASLLQMAAAPFRVGDRSYIGLAPGATYLVIPYDGDDERRLDRALDWVVANRLFYNIRVILTAGWHSPPPADPRLDGLVKNTADYPCVRALADAVSAGILVVAGNGNTSSWNLGPPAEYLAVGAYQDSGRADPRFHKENLDEPWGRNTDGHLRPDLLAPKYFVPNHRNPDGGLGYFGGVNGGTSCASAQVAGLCALLFERFPAADAPTIRAALTRLGDPVPGSQRPGVRVNADRTMRALKEHAVRPPWPEFPPPVAVADPNRSLESKDAVERALAVSALAWRPREFRSNGGGDLRQVCWGLLKDDAPTVRKAAASALLAPQSKKERARFWEALHRETDMGVRGQLAIMLVDGAAADPLDDWVPLANDPNWSARWCVIKVLKKHHPDAPPLDYAFLPEDIDKKAAPIFAWYRQRQEAR